MRSVMAVLLPAASVVHCAFRLCVYKKYLEDQQPCTAETAMLDVNAADAITSLVRGEFFQVSLGVCEVDRHEVLKLATACGYTLKHSGLLS